LTVTDLILNFRNSLLGLQPCFERVGIPWQRPDAYDEWDAVASAAYEALVVVPLRASLPDAYQEQFALPAYDMLLPSYAGLSVIALQSPRPAGALWIFHALGTSRAPFDTVECRTISSTAVPISPNLKSLPLESTRFALCLCDDGVLGRTVDEVSITAV